MNKIETLLEERKKYPIGAKAINKNQVDYILQKIEKNEDIVFLILPSFSLQKEVNDVKKIKELIFGSYYLSAIIGLGRIWEPYTTVQFNLIVLSKYKQSEILMCKSPDYKTFTSKSRVPKSGLVGNQLITEEYQNYLEKVESYLNGNENPLNGFKINYSGFDKDKFYINYYLPEYKEINEKLSKEKTVPLSTLADVILPRHTNEEAKVLRGRFYNYPLDVDKLPVGKRGKEELKKGDILIGRIGRSKSYLVSQDVQGVYTTANTYILRVKSDKVTPEYLFLFLQSEVAEKYVFQHLRGNILALINKKDLGDLPIILPQKETLNKSKQVFETLYLMPKEQKTISEINDLLFSKKLTKKPIQDELVNELLESVKQVKLDLLKEIIDGDIEEVGKCVSQKAFKASIILCGSILEAVLLDWISEMKNRDYISSKDKKKSLSMMINEMEEAGVFDATLKSYANKVKEYRNLVHPSRLLQKEIEINDKIAKDMLFKLKKILEKRNI